MDKCECPAIRVMMMPKDTNPMGIIFGGVLLSHMDIAGAIVAREHAMYCNAKRAQAECIKFVNVSMDAVEFCEPVYVGDVLRFSGEVIKKGSSSVTVKITVLAERFVDMTRDVLVTQSEATYVAIGDDRKPIGIFEGAVAQFGSAPLLHGGG